MIKIKGVGAFGNFEIKPITFKNTNIVINGSYSNLKLEMYGHQNELETLLEFYDFVCNEGEGGALIKPIIGMEIIGNKKYMKSKKIETCQKIKEFLEKEEFFKITIFFETTIQCDPLEKDYDTSNAYGISCIGGLYNAIDPLLYIEIEGTEEVEEAELYTGNKTPFDVEYCTENLFEYALETAKTAREIYTESKNGEIGKFDWH